MSDGDDVDGALLWETLGGLGSCGAAYWTEVHGPETTQSKSEEADMPLVTIYRAPKLRARQRLVVRQVTSLVPSSDHQQPHWHATRLAALGRRIGFETLRKDNAEAWRELWRGRVVLLGADRRWQSLADAAFFYLHTSTHRGSFSTHPFGLAQWHGYRIRSTDSARENARLNGFLGVQFPWEGSPSRGEEAAPGLGPAAAFEHHVSADVAKALADYVHATGDDVFSPTAHGPC
jgi:trehalose/maltose hydrolase-like predicted phosphorylase